MADLGAQFGCLAHLTADRAGVEVILKHRAVGLPMEALDLPLRQPHQRVAVAQRVIHEGQGVFPRQRHQPERDFGEVNRGRVLVHAVEAALGHEPPREDHFVLVGGDGWLPAMDAPGLDQRVAKLAAGFHQKGARAHRRVTDFQVEDLLGARRQAIGATQPGQHRLQGCAHNRFSQCARGVVRAGAAALGAGLEHHRPRRHNVGRGRHIDDRAQRVVQVGDTGCGRERLVHAGRRLTLGLLLHPARPLRRRRLQQHIKADRRRRAVFLGGADRQRPARSRLQPKAHHRLVDRADLLNIKRPVRDPLAVEQQQLLQGLIDRAVGHPWRDDALMLLTHAAGRAALEEGEPIRVEQHAVAARQLQIAGLHAVVDHAEKHQQARPGSIALLHRIRVERSVFTQLLVQPGQRVALLPDLVVRQHVPLFRVEQEDQAQDNGQQPAIDQVGLVAQGVAQQRATGLRVGGLEAAQQHIERVEHLLGQSLTDLILELAARLQQRSQALLAGQGQQALLAEQQAQGSHDWPTGGLHHFRKPEVQPARALATRGRDQAQRNAVAEQAGAHPALAQQPFHAPAWRGLQTAMLARHLIKVLAGGQHPHQQLPGRAIRRRVTLAHRQIRREGLAILRQRHLQLRRDRRTCNAGVALRREAPAQHRAGELLEIGDYRFTAGALLGHTRGQQTLAFGIAAWQQRTGTHQGRCRDHQTGGPHKANPLQMCRNCRVKSGCHQFVSGHT